MAEQLLDHANVDVLFQQMRGEAVPERVRGQWICFGLVESGFVAIRPAFRTEPD